MRRAVRVLSRPEAAAGFALAGLATTEVADPEEAAARLDQIVGDEHAGVVLIEESLYDALPEALVRRVARQATPMLVPFPAAAWGDRASDAEAYVVNLLRQVIGYRVRLR